MILVIDIGNTHTVSGIYKDNRIVSQWRIKTEGGMTSDELGITFHNLFSINNIVISKIRGVIISSVVPQLENVYSTCLKSLLSGIKGKSIINVTSTNVSKLISIKLENPAEVGADRLVNGIGAFSVYKNSCIVIDFGTAITFDCISEKCEYLGGLILPGLSIALEALTRKAAKLPQIDIMSPPDKVIGTSTVSAMKSGVMNGYGAMIEGLIVKVKNEMQKNGDSDPTVIATGGMSTVIQPYASSIKHVEPNLTLKGLVYIFQSL